MELHELIWARLSGDQDVTGNLTRFCGTPAVFIDEVPQDGAAGWGGESNYPRIVFNVDLSANEERRCQGTMVLSVFAENNGTYDFARAAAAIRRCLCDVFLSPEGESPCCFAWSRTDGFAVEGTNICGQEMQFDILEYPSQETTDPDPTEALSAYLKELFPEALILWHDTVQEEEEVEGIRPAFYCRLEREAEDAGRSTYTVAWMECTMAVHVFSVSGSLRGKYARAVSKQLSVDGVFCLTDRSPFFVTAVSLTPGADYLRSGQVRVSGRYGILRHREKKNKLGGVKTEYEGE